MALERKEREHKDQLEEVQGERERERGRKGGRERGRERQLSSILLTCAKFKVWMTIVESGWNVWVWLVGVVSRRWVWLVGVSGIYGCGYWVWL